MSHVINWINQLKNSNFENNYSQVKVKKGSIINKTKDLSTELVMKQNEISTKPTKSMISDFDDINWNPVSVLLFRLWPPFHIGILPTNVATTAT